MTPHDSARPVYSSGVLGVDGVFELAGEINTGGVAVGGFEELPFAAQLADEMAALDTGGLAHEDVDAVALGGADHGEGDAGVAAGAFDDDGVVVQPTARLGVLDDAKGEAVFDGAGGVEALGLGVERAVAVRDVQRDQRRVADERKDGRAWPRR